MLPALATSGTVPERCILAQLSVDTENSEHLIAKLREPCHLAMLSCHWSNWLPLATVAVLDNT